jgi:regulator of ribosome biosynthesis
METETKILKGEEILALEESLNKSTFDQSIVESIISVDIGNLLAFDPRPINSSELKKEKETFLLDLCTQGTQQIINSLFKLPTERVEDTIIVKLPKSVNLLPREKPLPKKKPLTKWEQYAKLKGIQKHKKGRKVWDEVARDWKPVWGKDRANDSTKQWLIEIPKNQDPNQDFFAKRTTEKNERVAKNELQRLRNIARATKKKVPGIGLTPTESTTNNKDKTVEKLHVIFLNFLVYFLTIKKLILI